MALRHADLTAAMEREFANAWRDIKGGAPPSAGGDDLKVMFAAVARGVLAYLKANENDVIDSLKVSESGVGDRDLTVTNAKLDIEAVQ
jgi:hypothetical protein